MSSIRSLRSAIPQPPACPPARLPAYYPAYVLQMDPSKEAIATKRNREGIMFIILAAVLLLLWLGGFLVFHVAGGLIHLLLVVAVIALIVHLMRPRTVV